MVSEVHTLVDTLRSYAPVMLSGFVIVIFDASHSLDSFCENTHANVVSTPTLSVIVVMYRDPSALPFES